MSSACGTRPLNRNDRISFWNPVSFSRSFDRLSVRLLRFSKTMTRLSYIYCLIDELQGIRECLLQVEENSPEWKRFDRLEDKLCAELADQMFGG